MSRTVILQSNYLPWRGYFDLIASADTLVIYDTVQFTKNDWRNRNRIKTANGLQWITVPVHQRSLDQTINETTIDGQHWVRKHVKSLEVHYAKAPYLGRFLPELRTHLEAGETRLTGLNERLMRWIMGTMGIDTQICRSEDIPHDGDPTDRLVDICKATNATAYLSGPAAKAYLVEAKFADSGIAVEWFDYSGYSDYPQLHGTFEPAVSTIDLLFNCGSDAVKYLSQDRST